MNKKSDVSLSAVLLFFIIALLSMAVFAVNETNSTDDTNITENKTIEVNATEETNQTEEVNETLPLNETNQTQPANQTDKTIFLDLKYKSGTEWDKDNNGLEAITGIIDLDVGSTEFSWEIDESKLCTRWEVYSVEDSNLTRLCFGSEKCCALMDLQPALSSWKDAFEVYFGRYGTSLLNRITAQVIYADYNLSMEDPFSEFYNSNTAELDANFSQQAPDIAFDRDIVCKKCSKHKVSPLTEFIMVISAGISTYFEGILSDYVPSAFIVINPIGGIVTEINENYTRIDWDVVGDNVSREYILHSPNRTMPTSKYYFYSELNNETSDEWMVVVADREIANQTGCTIPDVTFSTNDMQISGDTATFDKDGLAITLRGIATGRIKNLPVFKDSILTVDSSISVKNATISVPHCGIEPVMIKPRLYIREKGMEFKEAAPYCYNKTTEKKRNVTVEGVCDKENDPFCLSVKDETREITETETVVDFENCFNDVEITPTQYIFNVEHFTDYYINTSGGFKTLAACLKYINNTDNTCVINQPGYYDINYWQINASDSSFNKSGLKLAYDFDNGATPNATDSADIQHNGTINGDAGYAEGYYGNGMAFDGDGDYINSSAQIMSGKNASWGAWFKTNTAGCESPFGDCRIIGQQDPATYMGFGLVFEGDTIFCFTGNAMSNPHTVSADTWYNAVCTYNGTGLCMYVNGIKDSCVLSTDTALTFPLLIGGDSVNEDWFNGTIDQVHVWNRSLSQREIEEQYTGAVAKYNLYSHGIKISANNTVINLHGSTITGDGGNEEYGIYYYRKGGNITLENCIVEGFYHNYWLDSYGDSSGLFIKNCTSRGGVSGDGLNYGNYTVQNFIGENTKGISLLKTYGLYEDIYLNCSGSISGESCLFINQGDRNIFRRLNITTPSDPPAGLNSAVYLTDGGSGDGSSNNTIEDSYIKAPKIKAVSMYILSNYDNIIRNTTIEDSGIGIEFMLPSNSIINNTFKNTSRQAIIYKNSGVSDKEINITNNTILDAGNGTRDTDYRTGYSPIMYDSVPYNGTVKYIWNSGGSSTTVTANNTKIAGATGSNYWKLMLYQDDASPVLGCGNYCNGTLYLDDTYPYNCTEIVGNYGGACVEWYEAFIANGANTNYTWNSSIPTTVINAGADPPYLRFRNDSLQIHFPVEIITGSNWANITGNTIEITDGRQNYYSMNITADTTYNTNVWLNNFYTSTLISSGNVNLCNDGEGNFYRENIDVPYGDCGPANVTYPNGGETFDKNSTNIVTINWTRQSSIYSINYYLYHSNNSGQSWDYIDTTSNLNYYWDISLLPVGSTYLIKIVPYDNNYNATNDYSDNNFTIVGPLNNNWVCSNTSRCEYQTITAALEGENNTANTIYIVGSNEDYIINKTVSYNVTPIQINATNITLDCNSTELVGFGNGSGIYMYNQNNNTIRNCNITNYLYGIYLEKLSENNALISNVATNNTEIGIYLTESSNNTLINNLANFNVQTGISLKSSSKDNILFNNTANSNGEFGIKLYLFSDYNNLTKNGAQFNGVDGMYITLSSSNNIINNMANNNTETGIHLEASNNNLTNNTANSNILNGILLKSSSNNNILTDNTANSNHWGILLISSNNNTISNNTANSNLYNGIQLYQECNNNTLTGNTANSNIQGILLYNLCNNNTISNNTINSNYNGIQLQQECNNNIITDNLANNNTNYGIWLYINSSNNNLINNVANYSVSYHGILLSSSSNNNTLINNSANSNTQFGIYVYDSSNNNLSNNIAKKNAYYGILTESSSSSILFNNIAGSNNYHGIYIFGSPNTILLNNLAEGNGYYGIMLKYSSNNNLLNNIANSNNQYGILLQYSSNNNLTNNTANSNAVLGILLSSSSSNNLIDNIVKTTYYGIYLQSLSNNNLLMNNTASLNTYYGITLYSSSNNLLINNNLTKNNRNGIYIVYSDNNNITKNILNNTASGYYDLKIGTSDSDYNRVWLNNFSGKGVSDSGANTIFCVRGQGNYYSSSAAKPNVECQLDVYNLSVVYSDGSYRIFKFKTKNNNTNAINVTYMYLDTGETNISSSNIIYNLGIGKEIFTFVDYNYTGSGDFEVTAYATTLTDDEEKINITV